MAEHVIDPALPVRPDVFTQDFLGWMPWLSPLPVDELSEEHFAALVERSRAQNDYFRLLVRDPAILAARTKTDHDIFTNENAGLPRAERELSATAASRVNGCLFCASVHARFASHHSKRHDEVQRLLDEGIDAELDPRWRAIVEASVALTQTPPSFGQAHIDALREVGLDEVSIADVIGGAAFFNWANRLMLSLGEPTPPAG